MTDDFKGLFAGVWEETTPPEVLADYIVEQLAERPTVGRHTDYEWRTDNGHKWTIRLAFHHMAGYGRSIIGCWIVELSTADNRSHHFDNQTFTVEFPKWLMEWMQEKKQKWQTFQWQ